MYTQRFIASAAVLIAVTAGISSAQTITSAHSGLLHYFDGAVSIDGKSVDYKPGKFSEIKENSVLSTGQGRAEVLLTPGVYLRLGENTSIKMLDNRLLSTRVEFLSGSVILESDDPEASVKDPAVTLIYKDYQLQPLKYGVFEVTSDPAQVKVYKGQVNASAGSVKTNVKDGKLVVLSAALQTEKFDDKQVDDLYLWARDRGAALSAANMASARSLSANGFSSSGLYSGTMYPGLGFNSAFSGGWYLNSLLGMYTYIPYGGAFWSPFGYGYFSPGTIYSFYQPSGGYYWYGGGGARTTSFVPQPVAGGVVRTAAGIGAGSPVRLAAGHTNIAVPVAGAGSSSIAATRGGGFSPGMARVGASGGAAGGGRFGGTPAFGGFNPNLGGNPGMNNSTGFGGGVPSGGGASGGGGFSGASAGGGSMMGGGAHGGGAAAGGGRAR